MKVWIVTDIPEVDESMKILAVFSTLEAAKQFQKDRKVWIEGLAPRDSVDIEEWEVAEGEGQ